MGLLKHDRLGISFYNWQIWDEKGKQTYCFTYMEKKISLKKLVAYLLWERHERLAHLDDMCMNLEENDYY